MRALETTAIAPDFPCQEFLDACKRVDAQPGNIVFARLAAVAVDRVDLHPQAVVPVRAAQLSQPGARGDHKQDEQQDRDADGFEHG